MYTKRKCRLKVVTNELKQTLWKLTQIFNLNLFTVDFSHVFMQWVLLLNTLQLVLSCITDFYQAFSNVGFVFQRTRSFDSF